MPPEVPPPEPPLLLPDVPPLPPRERELLARGLEPLLREDFAPALDRFGAADLVAPADLRAPEDRLAGEADDLARDEVDEDFLAPLVDRFAPEERALPDEPPLLDRLPFDDEEEPDDLRPPLERDEDEDDEEPDPVATLARSAADHLPDITR